MPPRHIIVPHNCPRPWRRRLWLHIKRGQRCAAGRRSGAGRAPLGARDHRTPWGLGSWPTGKASGERSTCPHAGDPSRYRGRRGVRSAGHGIWPGRQCRRARRRRHGRTRAVRAGHRRPRWGSRLSNGCTTAQGSWWTITVCVCSTAVALTGITTFSRSRPTARCIATGSSSVTPPRHLSMSEPMPRGMPRDPIPA